MKKFCEICASMLETVINDVKGQHYCNRCKNITEFGNDDSLLYEGTGDALDNSSVISCRTLKKEGKNITNQLSDVRCPNDKCKDLMRIYIDNSTHTHYVCACGTYYLDHPSKADPVIPS